jgi:hypothetical protein
MLKNVKNVVYLIIFIFVLYLFFRVKTIVEKRKKPFLDKILEKFNISSCTNNNQIESTDCETNSDCNNNCCNPLTNKCNYDSCNPNYCILEDNEKCNADYECKSECCSGGKCQPTRLMCDSRQSDMGSMPGDWPTYSYCS